MKTVHFKNGETLEIEDSELTFLRSKLTHTTTSALVPFYFIVEYDSESDEIITTHTINLLEVTYID